MLTSGKWALLTPLSQPPVCKGLSKDYFIGIIILDFLNVSLKSCGCFFICPNFLSCTLSNIDVESQVFLSFGYIRTATAEHKTIAVRHPDSLSDRKCSQKRK